MSPGHGGELNSKPLKHERARLGWKTKGRRQERKERDELRKGRKRRNLLQSAL